MEKIKGLDALRELSNELYYCNDRELTKTHIENRLIIEKELKAIDSVRTKGVVLVVPESEYLNNEHISIQIYKKHFTNEQWQELLEVLDGQD